MMWQTLFNRAYGLCMKLNQQIILHDLPMMTESELMGVVNLLLRLQDS